MLPLPITRLAALAAVVVSASSYAAADFAGDYNVEFMVQETPYTGTTKATAGKQGAFTAKMEFTSPSTVIADVTGKTWGDSISYEAKYEDKGRGCSGLFTAKGTIAKDGSKANGTVDISDDCSGALTGTFRLWR